MTQFSEPAIDMPPRQQLSTVGKAAQFAQPDAGDEGAGGGLAMLKHVPKH